MKSSTIVSLVGVAVIMLIIGMALGSVTFPVTRTETTTLLSSVTSTETETQTLLSNVSGLSYPTITITYQQILVDQVVPTCTTISGIATVIYTYAFPGESTTVTYLFPPSYRYNLPSDRFYVTVTTNSTVSASNQTEPFSGSC